MSNQLIKTTGLGKENVFPRTRILDLFDDTSGLKLVDILKSFNMMFVPYLGNKSQTRNQISPELRRQGLWLTYVIDNTVYTEWYDEVAIDDTNWGSDANWRQGSNALVGDLSISPNGTWVINGEDSGITIKGDKGDSPVIRIYDNKILVSYNKGVTYEDLNNTPVYTKFRFNSLTNTYLVSYDLGSTWQDISDEKVYHKFRYNSTTNTYLESIDFGKTWSNISAEKVYYQFRYNEETNTHLVSTDLGLNWTDVSSNKVYYQFRTEGNRLLVSTDLGTTWENCSEPIAAWFRWADTSGAGNVGKVLISRDNSTWTDLSPTITNNLYIKGYVATVGNLPSNAAIGDIYMVGPTYDESDATHDYPHYRMWVKLSSGWVDNGEYLSNILVTQDIINNTDTGNVPSTLAVRNYINTNGIINISTNYNSDDTVDILTLNQAIAKVPSKDRVLGFSGTFLSKDGWINYRFTGSNLLEWNDPTKWITNFDFFNRFIFTNNAAINSIVKEIYIDFTKCKINADITRVKLHAIKRNELNQYSVVVKVYNRDTNNYLEGGAYVSSSSYTEDSVLSGTSPALGIKIYAIIDWSKVDGVISEINQDLIYPRYLNLPFSPSIYFYIDKSLINITDIAGITINTWVNGKYINIDNTVENVKDLVENPIDNDRYKYIILEIEPGDIISVPELLSNNYISIICFTDSLFNVLDRRCNSNIKYEKDSYILPPIGSAYLIINTNRETNPINLLGRGGRALSISNRYITNSFEIVPIVLRGYQLGQNGELLNLSSLSKNVCVNSYYVSKVREIFVELHRQHIDVIYKEDTLDYAFYNKNGEVIKLGNIIKKGSSIGKTMVLQVPKNAVLFQTSSHLSESNGNNKVFGVVNCSEYSEYKQNKNVLYVSSSLGNDNWDGRTFDSPLKSLNIAVNSCPSGGTILLKCGDTFYIESSLSLNNKNIASYSNGKKPIISHFRVLSDFSSNPFERASDVGDNIWKISMANTNFQDGVPYNTTYSDIGFIYDRYNDSIAFGHRVNCFTLEEMENLQDSNPQIKSYLKENGDFLQRDSDTIYLYYTGDLNADFETLEFACKGNCINATHSEIKDIKIEGFGSHGIATTEDRQNIYIHNVNIDLIGGSCLPTYPTGKKFVRFGNGIEFWIDINKPSKNIRVENCRISRTFDTGTTIQGYMKTDDEVPNGVYAENIVIEHNVLIKCRQAYECFCRKQNSSGINYADYPLKECYFKNNISISPGDNGFNSPETRDTHFLSGSSGMKIQGNTLFDGGMNFTRGYYMEFLRENVCYIREGDIMYSNNDKNTVVYPIEKDSSTWIEGATSYSDAVEKAIAKYRELLGDKYTTFIRLTDTLYNEMYSMLSNII